MKSIKVSAPGKLMLFGEHAVVYGYPCIVTAVSYRLRAIVSKIEGNKFHFSSKDLSIENYVKSLTHIGENNVPKAVQLVQRAVLNFSKLFPLSSGISIETKAIFSTKYGLGSSAAAVVATVFGLAQLFEKTLSKQQLFDIAWQTIKQVQGDNSGFDVAAAIFGGTLYFVTHGKIIETIAIDLAGYRFVIAYSGIKADTQSMIQLVRKKMDQNKKAIDKIFRQLGNITDEAKQAFLNKDYERIGTLMDFSQSYLEDLGVSTDKINVLIDAAKKAGAVGAKLSGAGGGDCIIALIEADKKKQVTEAIKQAAGEILDININIEGVNLI